MSSHEVSSFLPLKPRDLHILLTLHDEDLHGYGIIQAVEARTDGRLVLEPGSLYRTLRGMLRDGVIAECDARPDPAEDSRRRYYRVTSLGREVVAAETRRLRELLQQAEARVQAGGGPA